MTRETEIDFIVAMTGMGRLQALRHIQSREAAIAETKRRRRAEERDEPSSFRSIGDIVRPIVANIAERSK